MKYTEVQNRIEKWATVIGLLEKGTPLKQWDKSLEELLEMKETLIAQQNDLQFYKNSKNEIVNTQEQLKDDLGDFFVTGIVQCLMQNLDPLECLETALDIIEKRTGKIENGTFVKDGE